MKIRAVPSPTMCFFYRKKGAPRRACLGFVCIYLLTIIETGKPCIFDEINKWLTQTDIDTNRSFRNTKQLHNVTSKPASRSYTPVAVQQDCYRCGWTERGVTTNSKLRHGSEVPHSHSNDKSTRVKFSKSHAVLLLPPPLSSLNLVFQALSKKSR